MSCKGETKESTPPLEKVDTQNKLDEKYLLIDISLDLGNQLDQKEFTHQCFPVINRLYKEDSVKYKMVHIIGTKLSKESNIEAYSLGYENFKKEFNKLK
ncbi:hypothetical protein JCM19274_5048 [Algibacter lectus]|uniref:Uncharacterized protein n=2 Tax=Algibacter lectus TaxID=221126 RepID=A0A090WJT8_9FLAO|nr:hypothetical protein JCM19274_5048 [Algibacter lectus]